jgi:hypothetical protein
MSKKHYKIVFVLGVDVTKDGNGNFILAEKDEGGPLLSEWRLKAVQKLWEEKIVDRFVIVSYKQEELGEIWRSEVMKKILIEKYKLPEDIIETRRQSEKATRGNAIEIKRYLFDYSIKSNECAFLTNFYHIPRTVVIFQELNLFLRPLAAESFFVSNESDIRKDYGQTEFSFFDRLIKEMKGMKKEESGRDQD